MCWRVTIPNFIILCCFLVVSDSFGTDIEYPDTGALPGLSNYANEEDDYMNTTQTNNTTSPTILNINDTVQSENGDDANNNERNNLKPEAPGYSAKMYLRQHGNPNIKTSENDYQDYRQNDHKAYDYLDYGNQPGGVPYAGENPSLKPIEREKQATQYGQNQAAREARSKPVKKILRNSRMLYSQANADVKTEHSRNRTHFNEIGARFDPNNFKSGHNQFPTGQANNNEHSPINLSESKFYTHPARGLLYAKTTPTNSYPVRYTGQNYPVAHDSSPNQKGQNNGYRDNVQMSNNVNSYQEDAMGYAPNEQGNAILSQEYKPKPYVMPPGITMNNQKIPGPYPFNANSVVATNVGPNNYIIGQQEQGQPISRAKNANIFSGYTKNIIMNDRPNNITPQQSQVEYQHSVVLNQGYKPPGGYYMHEPANSNNGLNHAEKLNAYNNGNGYPLRNSNLLAQNQFQNHNLAAQYPTMHNENTQQLFQTPESQYTYQHPLQTNLNIIQQNPEEQNQNPENNKGVHPQYQGNQYQNTNHRNHQDLNPSNTLKNSEWQYPNNEYPGVLNQNQNTQNQEHQNQHPNNQDPELQKQNPNQKKSVGQNQNPEEQNKEPELQNQNSPNQNTEGQNQTPDPQNQEDLNHNTTNQGSEGQKQNFNPPNSEGQNQLQIPEGQNHNDTDTTYSYSRNGTENLTHSNPQNTSQNPGSDSPNNSHNKITQSPEVLKQSKSASPVISAPGVIDYDVIPGWYDVQFSSLSTSFTFPTIDGLLSGTSTLAPSTTPHYLVMEAKMLMAGLRWGYFLGFTYKLFQIFAKKDLTEGTHLITGLKNVVDGMVDSGVLKDMGSPAAPALKTVMSTLSSRAYQDVQNYLGTASEMIREKESAISQDLVSIINIIDAAYTLEEGDKLLEVLVDIDGYPENNLTPTEIGTALMNGLLQPYWRMAGTPSRDKLLTMINAAIESRFKTRRYNIDTFNNKPNDMEKKGHSGIGKLNKERTTKTYKINREHRIERDNRINKPRNSAYVIKSITSATRSYLRRIPYDDKIRKIQNHVSMGQDTYLYTERRKLTTRKLRTKHNKYDRFRQTEYNYEKSLRNRILFHTSNENVNNRHRFIVKGSKVDNVNIRKADVNEKKTFENFMPKAKSDIDNPKANTHKTVNERTEKNIISSNVSMSNQIIKTEDSVKANVMKYNLTLQDIKREITNNNDIFTIHKAKKEIDNVRSKTNMIEDKIKPVAINIAKEEEEAEKEVAKISELAVTKIAKNITKKIKSEITKEVTRKQASYKNVPEDRPDPNFNKIQKYNEFGEKEERTNKKQKQATSSENEEHIKQSKYLNPVVKQRLNFKNNKKYKKSIKFNETKSILMNIIEESSYSDEENQLKRVLSDAVRHGDFAFKNSRRNELVKEDRRSNEQSNYSDHEAVLKNNIYKVFGYDPDFYINAFVD